MYIIIEQVKAIYDLLIQYDGEEAEMYLYRWKNHINALGKLGDLFATPVDIEILRGSLICLMGYRSNYPHYYEFITKLNNDIMKLVTYVKNEPSDKLAINEIKCMEIVITEDVEEFKDKFIKENYRTRNKEVDI